MPFTEAQLTQYAANGVATALTGAQSQALIRDIVWNGTVVNRGSNQVPAIQELADAKTQAIAANAKVDAVLAALKNVPGVDVNALAAKVAALTPTTTVDYAKLADEVADELDRRELKRITQVKDA